MGTYKILAIGDIHGRDVWKKADLSSCDKMVFIGDYFDSFTIAGPTQLNNFKEILALKKENPEKVVLLLGNHDVHYLFHPFHRCSGFQPMLQPYITAILKENIDLFQIAYSYENHLWTHAGITAKFAKFVGIKDVPITELGDRLNSMFRQSISKPDGGSQLYLCGRERGGLAPCSGVVWADQKETTHDFILNLHQIVGHSAVPKITKATKYQRQGSVTYIDVLEKLEEFHVSEFAIA